MTATFEETTRVNETMIVEPDLPDHWKTRMLTGFCAEYEREHPGTLEPEGPIMLILRLWAHCQQRKAWVFPGMTDATLAAICRWRGEAKHLRWMLDECQWLDPDPQMVVVHQWNEANAGLISSWRNGEKGGRPRGSKIPVSPPPEKPTNNPPVTHAKPTNNPPTSQAKPIEKIDREDRERALACRPNSALASSPSVEAVIGTGKKIADGIPEDYCRHFHREKTKRRSWEKTDWVMDLEDWWRKDHASWGASARAQKNDAKNSGKNSTDKAVLEAALTETVDPDTRKMLMNQIAELP